MSRGRMGAALVWLSAVVTIAINVAVPGGAAAQSRSRTGEIEARVTAVGDDYVTIGVGSDRGLRAGFEGTVMYDLLLPDGSRKRVEIARARVIRTRATAADVRVVKSGESIRIGYRVRIALPLVIPPDDRACVGTLVVTTMPSAAAVTVDRQALEVGTAVLERVRCGAHDVEAKLRGYAPASSTVTVEEGKIAVLALRLAAQAVRLEVESVPSGAMVFIDGVRQGATPWQGDGVTTGPRRIRLEKDGFLPLERGVVVGEGDAARYRFPLDPCLGRVSVSTVPPGAQVVVSGRAAVGVTPLRLDDVVCGTHEVVVQAQSHEAAQRRVAVEYGQTARLDVTLTPSPSRLRIAVTPDDAEVRVDGRRLVGRRPEIVGLGQGQYSVEIAREGFVSLRERVTVDRPGLVEYTFALTPVPPLATRVSISTFGYEGVGLFQGLLTLGILTSEYAVELAGENVLDWRVLSTSTTLELPPGRHRLRVLMRTILGRTPQVIYDGTVTLASGPANDIAVNFLLNRVSVNGIDDAFNGREFRRGR